MDKIITVFAQDDMKRINRSQIITQIIIICCGVLLAAFGILGYVFEGTTMWLVLPISGIFLALFFGLILGLTLKRVNGFKKNPVRTETEIQEDGLEIIDFNNLTNQELNKTKIYYRDIKYFKVTDRFLLINKTPLTFYFKKDENLIKFLEEKMIKRKA